MFFECHLLMFYLRSCADKLIAVWTFSEFCDRLVGWATLSLIVEFLILATVVYVLPMYSNWPQINLNFLVGTQLSRLISDFLYLCSVELNWNSISYAFFCKYERSVLYFWTKFLFSPWLPNFKSLLTKFQFSVLTCGSISKCSILLWHQKFKCSVLFGGPNFNVLFTFLGHQIGCSVLFCGPDSKCSVLLGHQNLSVLSSLADHILNVLFSLGTKI